MPFDWPLLGLLAVAVALDVAGSLLFKAWAASNHFHLLGLGLLVYGVSLVLFAVALRRGSLGVIFALWVGLAAVLLTAVGWIVYRETLSPRQFIGIGLILIAVFLLQTE